ncbi:transmembrane protein, putative [Actinidia rufa]|uniref:Transmembrane protein, putative n=1 Tax=Actinidia rufa TaxID=165716 RepID=A0A7J0ESV7_9ERIC|nr:transmembrane protein, putative [Actinidia rufa]
MSLRARPAATATSSTPTSSSDDAPETPKSQLLAPPSLAQRALSQTLTSTANLANLLPTGTLLAFQLLTPKLHQQRLVRLRHAPHDSRPPRRPGRLLLPRVLHRQLQVVRRSSLLRLRHAQRHVALRLPSRLCLGTRSRLEEV